MVAAAGTSTGTRSSTRSRSLGSTSPRNASRPPGVSARTSASEHREDPATHLQRELAAAPLHHHARPLRPVEVRAYRIGRRLRPAAVDPPGLVGHVDAVPIPVDDLSPLTGVVQRRRHRGEHRIIRQRACLLPNDLYQPTLHSTPGPPAREEQQPRESPGRPTALSTALSGCPARNSRARRRWSRPLLRSRSSGGTARLPQRRVGGIPPKPPLPGPLIAPVRLRRCRVARIDSVREPGRLAGGHRRASPLCRKDRPGSGRLLRSRQGRAQSGLCHEQRHGRVAANGHRAGGARALGPDDVAWGRSRRIPRQRVDRCTARCVLGITTGNTLEAVVGALLLRRSSFNPSLTRVRDVLALVVWAAVLSTAIAATIGVSSLIAADEVQARDFWPVWRVWWLGDMGGDLLVATVIMVAVTHWPFKQAPGRAPRRCCSARR